MIKDDRKVKLKHKDVFCSLFICFVSKMSHSFWKCPHFFKGDGTLCPIFKFLGRTLIMLEAFKKHLNIVKPNETESEYDQEMP